MTVPHKSSCGGKYIDGDIMEYKTDFEKLMSSLDGREVSAERLVTDNPTPNTQRLFEFLKSCYGKKYISGQQYLFGGEIEDIVYYNACGKLPAIRGYDFMGISGLGGSYDQINRALDWGRSCGGIVTMCWHWYAPNDMSDIHKESSFYYKTTSYDHKTAFDIVRAVTDGTPENAFIIREIDLVADALKVFEKEDIPVIWRPLHEAYGEWFWWGNHGDESIEAYKKLWYTIFDRFMNYHKLTNLIWVWNGQNKRMAVHPNTYDIVGEDVYSDPPSHGSQVEKFREVTSYTHGKMAALSECGAIPEPNEMQRNGAKWLWWLPWWGSFVYESDRRGRPVLDENGNPRPNPMYMDEAFIKRIFNDQRVITLDSIPWRDSERCRLPLPLMKHLSERS